MKTNSINVPKTEANMIKCICSTCSSYTKCMETGSLGVFCSIGDAKGCLQGLNSCECQQNCSVSSDYNFSSEYHCNNGSAESQM